MPLKRRTDLSEEEKTTIGLNSNYEAVIDANEKELNHTLEAGFECYKNLDLPQAAKNFRKIAADLKHLESVVTTQGKFHPNNALNDLTGKQWLQHTKSWIIMDGKPQDITKEIKDHPASFPPTLAEHFISFFSKKAEWVFDPFMGIGSTAEACAITGRNCLGTELNAKYADYARTRIQRQEIQNVLKIHAESIRFEIYNADARETVKIWQQLVIPKIKLVITSPPYWNMLQKSRGGVKSAQKQRIENGHDEYYSNDKADLGNIDNYASYLDALVNVFQDLSPILLDSAYLIVILQNCRTPEGTMKPIAWDFASKMQETRIFAMQQEYIWLQDQKYMGIWGWPTTYVSNVHHHYCLIFQKIKTKK
jgi:DNA modification methylase